MSPKISVLLFDLDGTLIDSRADLTAAVNYALEQTGQPLQSQSDIVPHVGNGLRVLLGEVMGPVGNEVLEKGIRAFEEYYDEHCADHTTLYDGVFDSLRDLSREAKLGIVTNKPYRFADKIIKRLNIDECISVLLGGDSLPQRKPHPAPVLMALKNLGGTPASTLIVGDGHQDIQAGQAAGIKTCIAKYGYGFNAGVMELDPDYIIHAFDEIKEIVV